MSAPPFPCRARVTHLTATHKPSSLPVISVLSGSVTTYYPRILSQFQYLNSSRKWILWLKTLPVTSVLSGSVTTLDLYHNFSSKILCENEKWWLKTLPVTSVLSGSVTTYYPRILSQFQYLNSSRKWKMWNKTLPATSVTSSSVITLPKILRKDYITKNR